MSDVIMNSDYGNNEGYSSAQANNGSLYQQHQHQQNHRVHTMAGESNNEADHRSGSRHQYANSNGPMGIEEGSNMGQHHV